MTVVPVTLPYGVEAEGRWHRQALLRPVSGEDEDFLQAAGNVLLPAERLTALLVRCLVQLGPWNEVTLDRVRDLMAGDREALALYLRGLSFGDRLDCVLTCPECGERMDLALSASALLAPGEGHADSGQEVVLGEGEERQVFRLRSPTGRDLEEAARLALGNPNGAVASLLQRCVTSGDGHPLTDLSEEVVAALAKRLSRLDPLSDLLINMACPNCQAAIQVPFDPAGFLFEELSGRAETLYREVHSLALHYHWSEQEILRLPRGKRQRYLQLLADSLARPEAVV